MAKLLAKEIRLFTHPTSWMFLAFGAMMLIPGYPMYIPFFWVTLGLFYACLGARENNDLYYTLLLPVRKRDAVRARGLYFAVMELLQIAVCIPFAILRRALGIGPNPAGMDANAALFGLVLILMGLFNLSFLPRLYKNPSCSSTSWRRSSAASPCPSSGTCSTRPIRSISARSWPCWRSARRSSCC